MIHNFGDKFDCVISLSVIEHFGFSKRYGGTDNPSNNFDVLAFEKINKVVKDNGYVVISVPYAKAFCSGIWFRVYTRNDIEKKLNKLFIIKEKRYYSRKNNQWNEVIIPNNDPDSPHDGVALFLLQKKK